MTPETRRNTNLLIWMTVLHELYYILDDYEGEMKNCTGFPARVTIPTLPTAALSYVTPLFCDTTLIILRGGVLSSRCKRLSIQKLYSI